MFLAQNDVRNRVLSIEVKQKAARQPVGWLTAFEQSHHFFSKKIDKKHQTFWLLDKEVNRDCQNGRIIFSQRSIPHFSGGSLRLEQHNLRQI